MNAEEIDSAMQQAPSVQRQEPPAGTTVGELLPWIRPPRPDGEVEAARRRIRDKYLQERAEQVRAECAAIAPRIDKRILAQLQKTRTPCVLLLGPTGVGKTSAMHWLRAQFSGAFLHARELGSCERRHGLGEGYPPELRRVRDERVIYLDDIGAEDPRDLSVLQFAIDCRYAAGLATVATSGLTKVELSKHLGAAYVRRLREQHVRRGDAEWPVVVVDLFQG